MTGSTEAPASAPPLTFRYASFPSSVPVSCLSTLAHHVFMLTDAILPLDQIEDGPPKGEPRVIVESEDQPERLLLETRIVKDDGFQKQQGMRPCPQQFIDFVPV